MNNLGLGRSREMAPPGKSERAAMLLDLDRTEFIASREGSLNPGAGQLQKIAPAVTAMWIAPSRSKRVTRRMKEPTVSRHQIDSPVWHSGPLMILTVIIDLYNYIRNASLQFS
jgi:hypothetical protein